jgi:hypothetical protein
MNFNILTEKNSLPFNGERTVGKGVPVRHCFSEEAHESGLLWRIQHISVLNDLQCEGPFVSEGTPARVKHFVLEVIPANPVTGLEKVCCDEKNLRGHELGTSPLGTFCVWHLELLPWNFLFTPCGSSS